jgi:hypothetical protein
MNRRLFFIAAAALAAMLGVSARAGIRIAMDLNRWKGADASPQAMRSFVSAEHAEAAGSLTLQSYSPERT